MISEATIPAFIWYFLSMKGRIGPQEFRLGLLGLVLVDMLVVRIARKLTDSGPQYYSVNPPLDWPIVPAVLFLHSALAARCNLCEATT